MDPKIPYKLTFILPLIAVLTREPEMLQPDAFCEHIMQQNATAAGTSPRTTLGELTALPSPLVGFKGPEGIRKGGKRKGKGEEGQEGRGRGGMGRGG